MTRETFERIVEEEFEALPDRFRKNLDNVRIIVDDGDARPGRHGTILLGLYQGIPLTRRGGDYGAAPVLPDTITLFRTNIEMVARSEEEIREEIRKTLVHEIGHYYGMSEAEIRDAGY